MFPEQDTVTYPYRMRGWLVALIGVVFPPLAYFLYFESFFATFAGLTGRADGIIVLLAEIIYFVAHTDLDESTRIACVLLAICVALFPLLTFVTYVYARVAGTALSVGASGISLSHGLWRDEREADYKDIESVRTIRNRYFRTLHVSLRGGDAWDIQSRFLPSGATFDAVVEMIEAHVAKGDFDAGAGSAEAQRA